MQDGRLNIKEQSEHGLSMDSLSKAEDKRDFQEYLKLLREIKRLR
jgi:hypothetical protein